MDRPELIITLALVTMALVMLWAWYTKRRAQSGEHHFGKPHHERERSTAGGRPRDRR